jgi:hypothetical protein
LRCFLEVVKHLAISACINVEGGHRQIAHKTNSTISKNLHSKQTTSNYTTTASMMTPTSTNTQILVDCQQQCEQLKKQAPFRWSFSSSSLHAHFTRQQAAAENEIDEADDDSMVVMTDMFIWSTYIEQEEEEDEGSDQELLKGSSQRSNSSSSTSSTRKSSNKTSEKLKDGDDDDDVMKDSTSRRSKTSSKSSSKKSHAKRKEQRRRLKEELPKEIVFADKKQNSILDATSICKSQLSPPAA